MQVTHSVGHSTEENLVYTLDVGWMSGSCYDPHPHIHHYKLILDKHTLKSSEDLQSFTDFKQFTGAALGLY